VPVPVDTGGHAVLAITSGADFYCAVYDDHQARCWGDNTYGQLARGSVADFGDGPGETNVGPIPLPAGRSVLAVSAGAYHACALLDDGQVRCWGRGEDGALGQGNTDVVGDQPGESTVGVDLGGAARALVSGGYLTCAVTATGIRCWGWNLEGQLGQGSHVPNYGTALGEVPRLLPPIALGGETVGRDSDHDGVRDAADGCPAVAGGKADGCPEATLKGRKVTLDVVLAKTKGSAKCPRTAAVTVRTKSKHGRLSVRKELRTKADPGGCRVKGKVRLPAKPKKLAKVKVAVSGKKLKTRHLVAVRS
jgi:alpha-tubulin suppressor-like RCC1 family protein